ncbi:MAG TPA: hypothetical protein P5235_05505 [Saprospiraceae bacterium]|nr:hypothetical protein [Saprospiraceae bacterium]
MSKPVVHNNKTDKLKEIVEPLMTENLNQETEHKINTENLKRDSATTYLEFAMLIAILVFTWKLSAEKSHWYWFAFFVMCGILIYKEIEFRGEVGKVRKTNFYSEEESKAVVRRFSIIMSQYTISIFAGVLSWMIYNFHYDANWWQSLIMALLIVSLPLYFIQKYLIDND